LDAVSLRRRPSPGGGDLVQVTADDEEAPGAGKADVEVFAAASLVAQAVDRQDDDAPFESFEAEDVAVEHVLVGEERVPVAVPTVAGETLAL
jgi:hypothetical protein